jgi:hypothetical protein
MNIIQLEDNLKSLPDSNLQNEMTNPTGMFPQYLVMSEIQRREDMRKDYEGRMASNEKTPPLPSMREQMMAGITQSQPPVQDSGIAGLLPAQPQGAPIPPAMSAGPDVMPMYGGGVVGMNDGMGVPNIYDKEYEDYLEKLTSLEEKEQSLYEQLMAEQPERIEEERKFGQGMALLRAGIAVGTSATPKDLGKNLEATINSLDATNKSISAKKDKLTELELKKSSLDVKRLGDTLDKRTNILSKKDSADYMRGVNQPSQIKVLDYIEKNPNLSDEDKTLLRNSITKASPKDTESAFRKSLYNLAAKDFTFSDLSDYLIDNNLEDTDENRKKYRIQAIQEKADEFYQGYLGFEQGYYSGGVVGQSVQNFNDTIKLLNA